MLIQMLKGFFIVVLLQLFWMAPSYSHTGSTDAFLKRSGSQRGDTLQNISLMFEIRHGQTNVLDIKSHPFFRSNTNTFAFGTGTPLKKGMELADDGTLSWTPEAAEFLALKEQMFSLGFYGIDQHGDYVIGQIRIYGSGELAEEPAVIPETVVAGAVVTDSAVAEPLSILLPDSKNWDSKKEGEGFNFRIAAKGGSGTYRFELMEPAFLMESLDGRGNFNWIPDYKFVQVEDVIKSLSLNVKITDSEGNEIVEYIPLTVEHVNRQPNVGELPVCYIQFNTENSYLLKKDGIIYDPDGDSLIFRPVLKELPQGMEIDSNGRMKWFPSTRQFNYLRANPMYLSFTVEDYPAGTKVIGQVRMEVSQADLPPQITIIPKKDVFDLKEDEELKLSFFITDPNGEEDILSFGFVSENSAIREESLTKKDLGQYDFGWTPGFEFIKEAGKKEEFEISFFAIDKESNRTEQNIIVTVIDTENQLEKDRVLYDQYRTVLERSWDLITQLNEKEKELEKEYKKAKKGKKNRAISTAGLGALTGLSPVIFMENPQGQKITAGIGGTATATIGTLEASNVIGASPSDLMRDLNYVSQKRNDLLVYGNVFASRYALPVNKREGGFQSDLRSLSIQLNLSDTAKLELDASWENSKDASAKNLKKVFKDFNPDARFERNYDQ